MWKREFVSRAFSVDDILTVIPNVHLLINFLFNRIFRIEDGAIYFSIRGC